MLLVGKVIRPHGVGGLLRILSYARSEQTFLLSGMVSLKLDSGETREHRVLSIVPHKNYYLMRLEGLGSVETADRYKGADLFVRKDAVGDTDEGEYFWHEIIGLKVYVETGRFIGTVRHILSTGSNDIYVVQEGEGEVLVPAIHEVVKEIDLDKKQMIVSEMEGLLDLNEA